ncbi:MAG TPA: flavin reductase [Alphaproteobacteria bacterium]|nr:flavin reductase [Alphaproteobacteria bacterium]
MANQDDTRQLRNAFGRFATGVCVVSCQSSIGPVGITVNSFSSVSLRPALLSWCIAHGSDRYDAFAQAETFHVDILHASQEDVAMHFARQAAIDSNMDLEVTPHGLKLPGSLVHFACRMHARYGVGDHDILVGEIFQHEQDEGPGLGYFGGKFINISNK